MPDIAGPARRARRRLVVASLVAFVIFNAIFDVRILLAIRGYVDAAERAAQEGTFLRVQDSLGQAIRQGLLMGGVAAVLVLAAGILAARSARQSVSRGELEV